MREEMSREACQGRAGPVNAAAVTGQRDRRRRPSTRKCEVNMGRRMRRLLIWQSGCDRMRSFGIQMLVMMIRHQCQPLVGETDTATCTQHSGPLSDSLTDVPRSDRAQICDPFRQEFLFPNPQFRRSVQMRQTGSVRVRWQHVARHELARAIVSPNSSWHLLTLKR
jgi:hypothetical protein